jgi:hypothetical protein
LVYFPFGSQLAVGLTLPMYAADGIELFVFRKGGIGIFLQ